MEEEKNLKKKIVVALLVACMSASALQSTQIAKAAEQEDIQTEDANAETEQEGRLGESLSWKVEGDTLTISGEGEMPDKGILELTKDLTFTKVVIEEGVTRVGAGAFMHAGNVTEVSLPDSLESIGEEAFFNTDHLKKVSLPKNLTSLGDSAFKFSALEEVNLPAGLKEVGSEVFSECHALKTVIVEEGVSVIGPRMFSECSEKIGRAHV